MDIKKLAEWLKEDRSEVSVTAAEELIRLAEQLLESAKKAQWEDLPVGWTRESVELFWKSIGGSVTKCIDQMEGQVDNAGAFCASLKDTIERTTEWRGKEALSLLEAESGDKTLWEVIKDLRFLAREVEVAGDAAQKRETQEMLSLAGIDMLRAVGRIESAIKLEVGEEK